MSAVMKRRLLVLPLLALSLQFCSAQAPSGAVNFAFGSDTPVFDLTGNYQFDQQITGAGGTLTDLSFGISFANDPRGGLTGSGTTLVSIGDGSFAPFAANYVVHGRISGGGAQATRVTLAVRLFGVDTVAGVPNTPISITIAYNLTVDPVALALNGTSRGQVSLGRLGSSHINSDVGPISLPDGVDGTWVVQMTIVPLRQLGGSATIVVGNVVDQNLGTIGRTLTTSLNGNFSARSDLARVRLTGQNDSRGTSLNVTFDSSDNLDALNGTIMGQKVLISATPATP
jgi:hypothetical protein